MKKQRAIAPSDLLSSDFGAISDVEADNLSSRRSAQNRGVVFFDEDRRLTLDCHPVAVNLSLLKDVTAYMASSAKYRTI
jgi:hypothetical protein